MADKEMVLRRYERLSNTDHFPEEVIVRSIRSAPVTEKHKPSIPSRNSKLQYPGTARANIAASTDSPHGTQTHAWAEKHSHQTVLQQHCDFFDQDRDGIIWPQDTFIGFYRLGFGIILSVFAAFIIHVSFSYATSPSWVPDVFFRIWLKRIERARHGSGSGAYDAQGRFVPQNFEDVFAKYCMDRDYMTFWDVVRVWGGQRCLMDFFGQAAAVFEWTATYILLWPEDGRMAKEDVRGVFDGSIFYTIAERRAKGEKSKDNREEKAVKLLTS